MAQGEKIIGIDLGTTNSVVAVMEGTEPKVIPSQEGSRLVPSVVAYNDQGETLVGEPARRQAITNPTRTIYSVKRFMGRRHHEVESEEKMVPIQTPGGVGPAAPKHLSRRGSVQPRLWYRHRLRPLTQHLLWMRRQVETTCQVPKQKASDLRTNENAHVLGGRI